MNIVKKCFYYTSCINLLPSVVVTPLYVIVSGWQPHPLTYFNAQRKAGNIECMTKPDPWFSLGGFRVAFKFLRFHAGIEVHYNRST